MTAASTPTQSCKRELGSDDAALMPPTQILKRGENDAPLGVHSRKLLELHVEDSNGMWWEIPRELSLRLLDIWRSETNLKVVYLWDWEGAPACYMIDFVTMRQRKIQDNREYRIKIVEVMATATSG